MAEEKLEGTTREELLEAISQSAREGHTELDLSGRGIAELPNEIGQLANLQTLDLSDNQLVALPDSIGQLDKLENLELNGNQLSELPGWIGQLVNLRRLNLSFNQLGSLPESLGQLTNLRALQLQANQLSALPDSLSRLVQLDTLFLGSNQLDSVPDWLGRLPHLTRLGVNDNPVRSLPASLGKLDKLALLYLDGIRLASLPEWLRQLTNLRRLSLSSNQLTALPEWIGQLGSLEQLDLDDNQLAALPEGISQLGNLKHLKINHNQLAALPKWIRQLGTLEQLELNHNQLAALPSWISRLGNLTWLELNHNQLTALPGSLARLGKLHTLDLDDNPLNPALQSAYQAGLEGLRAYLRSLQKPALREPLYEARLILVGEGGVGKTTLLKAMTGRKPRKGEPTTHGVNIDIQALRLPHPEKEDVEIQFNAWDFGGQEVYRPTHQFFFSRRSIYLLVWEPRMGVQQCQVEDWLRMIRLRVGDDARVIIVSTHCRTGQRIARIDKPVFERDFGAMIVGFHEVDSMVDDPETGEKVGVAELKRTIAETAKDLDHMGMPFNRDWREARDELLALSTPHITYQAFAAVCEQHGLDSIATKTLASLMHDLGYITYFGDDERLKDDIVLRPEWLSKAIGFVLEDRKTQAMEGLLPDSRLKEVWWDKPIDGKTHFDPALYPFFLRLMEKHDVSYRLEKGDGSLVAQHVPQVRPELPWLPEEEPAPGNRRIAMACAMDEEPPGLVPWMIVRTHEYAYRRRDADGREHPLHWQKGLLLRYKGHGQAMLELRGREFHIYAEAVWPEFFLNVIRSTLQKLITDNWPGMEGRYAFVVPCPEPQNGSACSGRFNISALRQFLEEGDETIRCQVCRKRLSIVELLYGFEEEDTREQLVRIETKLERGFAEVQKELEGLESRVANYVMAIMQAIASESKAGPRLFTIEPVDGIWDQLFAKRYRLHLWCEAEGCQHPVLEDGKGVYEFEETREWVRQIAPYANFIASVLKTVLPVASPAANLLFGPGTIDQLGIKDHLDLIKAATGSLLKDIKVTDPSGLRQGVLTEAERSGVLALHAFLREKDPDQERLGLKRIPTYTGDYLWLCQTHYERAQPKIPERIE